MKQWWLETMLLVSVEALVYHAVEPFYIILKCFHYFGHPIYFTKRRLNKTMHLAVCKQVHRGTNWRLEIDYEQISTFLISKTKERNMTEILTLNGPLKTAVVWWQKCLFNRTLFSPSLMQWIMWKSHSISFFRVHMSATQEHIKAPGWGLQWLVRVCLARKCTRS